MIGNAEMHDTVAFLHVGLYRFDLERTGMVCRRAEMIEQRQPFEVSACREDDVDLSGVGRVEHLLRACPEGRDVLGRIDFRVGCVVRGMGEIETRVENPGFTEGRAPARKGNEAVEIEFATRIGQDLAKGLLVVEPRPRFPDPAGVGHFGKARGNAAFL